MVLRALAQGARSFAHRSIVRILAARMRGRFKLADGLLFTGSPRSGTTWLGQLFFCIPKSTILFEPLMIGNVPEAKAAGFEWRTYKRPEESWPDGREFLTRVFEGRSVNPWVLGDLRSIRTAGFARTLIVKSVRANRILPWIVHNLPIRPPLMILRHPCAVVASQMAYGAWQKPKRPSAADFLADHPQFCEIFERVQTPEEFLALTWAIDTFVPLASEHAAKWLLITYEELRQDPHQTLQPVFDTWGLTAPGDFGRAWDQPSRTTATGSQVSDLDGWTRKLSGEQVRRILAVAAAFGLDFYGQAAVPDLAILRNPDLASRLRG